MTLLDNLKRLDETKRVDGWDRILDFFQGVAVGIIMVALFMWLYD